ncbi:hypothetical protein KEF29_11085 [Streptomyces tuirus]|uniref:Uncharacterized protein n=1 Tax=Streptomyces tuirus TaxID=68278 RepID=A0A941FDN1_9ACTN|nr:hypothetical protein [Streptomyces tuirus]
MPVAVVGSGAVAESVVDELKSAQDGAADPRLVADRGKRSTCSRTVTSPVYC